MKKYFFMAVAGMLALSSCSNDSDEMIVNDGPRPMTFIAGYGDGADTRATLNGYNVSWDANDKISILSEKNTNKEFTTPAGGATATFEGSASNDSKFYAVYPYTEGLTLDGTTINGIKIPTVQFSNVWASTSTDATSGWDPQAPIALATADAGAKLQFNNLCAILKATLRKASLINSVEITVADGENIAGTFDLDTEYGTLSATEGSKTIKTTTSDSFILTQKGDRVIYLAIAPGTYSRLTYKMNYTIAGYAYDKSLLKKNVTFEKGKIYDLGTYVLGGYKEAAAGTITETFSADDISLSTDKKTVSTVTKNGIKVTAKITSGTDDTFIAGSLSGYKPNANDVKVQFTATAPSGKNVVKAILFGTEISGPGPWTFTYDGTNWTYQEDPSLSFYGSVFDAVTIYTE